MRTAAVVNLKGGVGKSTTAINMALIMSQVHGKKGTLRPAYIDSVGA